MGVNAQAQEDAWQALHDALGEAKEAARAALDLWRDAEKAGARCPRWIAAARRDRFAPPCECHGPALVEAYQAYEAAKAAIPAAMERVKAGVT